MSEKPPVPRRSNGPNVNAAPDESEDRSREAAHPTRAQDPVHETAHGDTWDRPWEPPSNLDAPPPRPGMAQRWVRTHIGNEEDTGNVQKKFREGWRPRRADSVPADFPMATIEEGRHAGCIGVHGMILCEMPMSRLQQASDYYDGIANSQMQRVQQDLADQRGMGPVLQARRTEVTKGRRRPPVQDTLTEGRDDQ